MVSVSGLHSRRSNNQCGLQLQTKRIQPRITRIRADKLRTGRTGTSARIRVIRGSLLRGSREQPVAPWNAMIRQQELRMATRALPGGMAVRFSRRVTKRHGPLLTRIRASKCAPMQGHVETRAYEVRCLPESAMTAESGSIVVFDYDTFTNSAPPRKWVGR